MSSSASPDNAGEVPERHACNDTLVPRVPVGDHVSLFIILWSCGRPWTSLSDAHAVSLGRPLKPKALKGYQLVPLNLQLGLDAYVDHAPSKPYLLHHHRLSHMSVLTISQAQKTAFSPCGGLPESGPTRITYSRRAPWASSVIRHHPTASAGTCLHRLRALHRGSSSPSDHLLAPASSAPAP